jgi:hypothetical protein
MSVNVDLVSRARLREGVDMVIGTLECSANSSTILRAGVRYYTAHLRAVARKSAKLPHGDPRRDEILETERNRIFSANGAGARLSSSSEEGVGE